MRERKRIVGTAAGELIRDVHASAKRMGSVIVIKKNRLYLIK